MKKAVLSLTLLSATLFAAEAPVLEPKPAPVVTMTDEQAALLKRFDRNQDGRLDEAELAAAHESMLKGAPGENGSSAEARKRRSAFTKRFDRNGDGELDAAEKSEMRRWTLEQFDTNHDGRLDDAERAAMRAELKSQAKALKLK